MPPRGSRAGYATVYGSTYAASFTEFSLQYSILKVVSRGCGVTTQPRHNFFNKKAVLSQGAHDAGHLYRNLAPNPRSTQ